MSYAASARPPKTLTDAEVARLLKVSGEHKDGFRDHVIFSCALGMALRESEIVALTVGDVSPDGVKVRRVVQLRVFKRAGAGADPHDQRVHVPDATYHKLVKYLAHHLDAATRERIRLGGEWRENALKAPLFMARKRNQHSSDPKASPWGQALSTRSVRAVFLLWQRRAAFDHLYHFHALRHTAITNVRRATGDIRIAQRFARHQNIGTTTRYEHASDQELVDAVRRLPA